MFSRKLIFLLSAVVSLPSLAGYAEAQKKFGVSNASLTGHRDLIIEISEDGYYFSLIPWVKEYLAKYNKVDSDLDRSIDHVMNAVGVKTFESLPESMLKKVNSPNVRYILAKRYLSASNYSAVEGILSKVEAKHPAYPFVTHLLGVNYSHKGDYKGAVAAFNDCVNASEKRISKIDDDSYRNQMGQNKDYCLAGIARAYYGMGEYKQAELSYIDIPKESIIWPTILFEEAWNSFQLKNYNRTLGKLVTYKAPVMDFVFNPEVEVLKAISYLKMCLYDDARSIADDFYSIHNKKSEDLRKFILRHGKNYKYYYELMANFESGKEPTDAYVLRSLKSIQKDGAYLELRASLTNAIKEYKRIQNLPKSNLKNQMMRNIRTVLDEYKSTLGAYVRSSMVTKYAEFFRAFQDMSYIKLEVLAQRKEQLYKNETQNRSRGDLKYIERNDKQYFWNFNGEFWADELGDYVFALRSEC